MHNVAPFKYKTSFERVVPLLTPEWAIAGNIFDSVVLCVGFPKKWCSAEIGSRCVDAVQI